MDRIESVEFARKYLQDIISFFGENIDVTAIETDEVINLRVETSEINSILIGRNAETLRSLQFIVSSALRSKNAEIFRVNVDVADYKKQREDKLADSAKQWIKGVLETGESYTARLNAADRRVVHNVASDYNAIETHSVGEGRDRKIIISKK